VNGLGEGRDERDGGGEMGRCEVGMVAQAAS
jgi:hypothetical protein